jgi:hypothetical protein
LERVDPLGLWASSHEDFGQFGWDVQEVMPPSPFPTYPLIGKADGEAWIDTWDVNVWIVRRAPGCWVVKSNGKGSAKYWWGQRNGAEAHELEHVRRTRDKWKEMADIIQGYTDVCWCYEKASCFRRITRPLSKAFKDWAEMWSTEYDVQTYDSALAKDWLAKNQARIVDEIRKMGEELKKCSSM